MMEQLEQLFIELLGTTDDSRIHIIKDIAKLNEEFPKVNDFLNAIGSNASGIFTAIDKKIVDDAFDAITKLYRLQIEMNSNLSKDCKTQLKDRLDKTRKVCKLSGEIILRELGVLIEDTQVIQPQEHFNDSENYKRQILQRGSYLSNNFKGLLLRELNGKYQSTFGKEEIQQYANVFSARIEVLMATLYI